MSPDIKIAGRGKNKVLTADVVVIGGGPGGSIAARKCAQHGMHTILLEKQALPRRKVCSGMLLSNLARVLIEREFGIIPEHVLTDPPYLLGYQWHTANFGNERQDMPRITNIWRQTLDYWMNQKAKQAGVEIWEESVVKSVVQDIDSTIVKVGKYAKENTIQARFVIGADGANSVTRKCLFPDLKTNLIGIYEECHPGTLNIERQYFHIFGSAHTAPSNEWFDVIHKKDCFLINVNGAVRPPKEAMVFAKKTLAEKWGFDIRNKPLWTDGTAVPTLRDVLYSGEFLPAKGNIILVGDAAGIATPSERGEGEGINMALKTGLLAANSIMQAADNSVEASGIYLSLIGEVISICRTLAANIIYYTTNWKQREELLDQLV